ncbi:hypothetical protein C0J52_23572 [Blattella germanica]|nr:hypothetical protein C0J52_23572 [Blattella germanica]
MAPRIRLHLFLTYVPFLVMDHLFTLLHLVARLLCTHAPNRNVDLSYTIATEYKSDSDIGGFLKYFFGLPFLPQDVDDCFTEYLMGIQPQHEGVQKFTDYVLEEYIKSHATFPPELWAEFEATAEKTTNSCCGRGKQFSSL